MSNSKIFDRNFVCDQSFASFNERILDDREFNLNSKLISEEDSNDVVPIINDFDRMIGIQPDSNFDDAAEMFRDMTKVNVKKMNPYNTVINNPNKKYSMISKSNNLLAMKMVTYYQYKKNNFVCSSMSLLMVMLLFYVGLNKGSDSSLEMDKSLNINDRNIIYNGLTQLNDIYKKSKSISINSIILVSPKIKLKKNYIDMVSKIALIDKIDNNTVNKVNSWTSKNTNGMIKQILTPNDIDNYTMMILVNTVYFKSNWKMQFDKNLTEDKEFSTLIGQKIVSMMRIEKEEFNYFENRNYQLIELPYNDPTVSMGFLLEKGYNDVLIPPTDLALLNNINKMKSVKCNVEIPKFTEETTIEPIDLMKFIGINKIFQNADCQDIIENNNDNNNIYISNIIQKTKIIVDEEGTEAASATALIAQNYSASSEIKEPIINFIANHPFIYYIRHLPTNSILFTGVYK
jgi:serine protease inhibitor